MSRPRRAKLYALIGALAAAGIAALLLAIALNGGIDQSVYSISYLVKALPEEGALNVDIDIDVSRLSRDRSVLLYKGMMDELALEFTGCADGDGNEVPFSDTPDLVSIGPIDGESRQARLRFSYNVVIGSTNDDEGYYGMPLYAQGCLLDDLIAFSGEYALLIPFLDSAASESMGKYVKSVSFEFVVPEGLAPIIPYQPALDGQLSFSADKPDWEFFNRISKSAFCFGQFERYEYDGAFGDAAVYADKAIAGGLSRYALDAMTGFLFYYTNLFGEPLGEVPIVLLRSLPGDGTVITAGVGSGGAAMSADMRLADDFQAMSNMVFHAFFDSKVWPLNLRYVGYEWIYRGMAELCVAASADFLPEDVKERYSIGDAAPMSERYMRYLYFSLKEPGFLALGPADEMTGMYVPQEDFYFKVKAPLVIDAVNFLIAGRGGPPDGFLKELVKRGGSAKPIDVEKLLKDVCGDGAEPISGYLSGNALIPNSRGFGVDGMPDENILYMLDQDERRYTYFFGRHNVFYPYSSLVLLDEEPFMAEVAERGVRYNSDEVQGAVRQFSNVVHRLLLQRAMLASFAGVDDITVPNISRELAQTDVRDKWSAFCEEVGFEYRIEDYNEALDQ
jgi:hypothetical protein